MRRATPPPARRLVRPAQLVAERGFQVGVAEVVAGGEGDGGPGPLPLQEQFVTHLAQHRPHGQCRAGNEGGATQDPSQDVGEGRVGDGVGTRRVHGPPDPFVHQGEMEERDAVVQVDPRHVLTPVPDPSPETRPEGGREERQRAPGRGEHEAAPHLHHAHARAFRPAGGSLPVDAEPGEEVVAADTPVGKLGLAVCYDVRFPALFEALGRERCDVIAIPAAFTVPTGKAHWHLLQRARAVEASAYVIAAAQVGEHADGRRTYGHSLVVDAWGEIVLDMGGEAAGVGFAEIDPRRTAEIRQQLPSLANRRPILTSLGR